MEKSPEASDVIGDGDFDGKEGAGDDTHWGVSAKKRKRAREREGLKGVKARRTSSTNEEQLDVITTTSANGRKQDIGKNKASPTRTSASPIRIKAPTAKSDIGQEATPPKKGALGLVGYDSDEDSD